MLVINIINDYSQKSYYELLEPQYPIAYEYAHKYDVEIQSLEVTSER
jgi:hypothetical protein